MDLKIFVSGRNRRIAADVCEHIEKEKGIPVNKCAATKSALFDIAINDTPHVVVVCMGEESNEEIKVYDTLKDIIRIGYTTLIVIADDEQRQQFIEHTQVGRLFFLSSPVSMFALYQKIEEVRERVESVELDLSSIAFEYTRPDCDESFERKHILVVDDEPEQLGQMKEHLSEFYDVTAVPSGRNALRYLERFTVDMIFLDLMMPDMDGMETYKQIREFPAYRDTPIVFLTGSADKDTLPEILLDIKPQKYIVKPATKIELVTKVIELLG